MHATIYIYDKDNTLVAAVNSDAQSLKQKQRKEFSAKWPGNAPMGYYRATAAISYDGVLKNAEQTFTLGQFFLKPLSLSVDDFKLGEVAKFSLLLENMANILIEDVQAAMQLTDANGNMLANIRANPIAIDANAKQDMFLFWPTQGISEGIYYGSLTMSYQDKKLEKQIKVWVHANKIDAEILGISGMAISPITEKPQNTEPSSFMMGMLVMLVIILVLVIIILVVWHFKSKDR